jgi:putative sporulation protein YtaF
MQGATTMTSLASMLLLAFAVSLDGFGVGITYGVRKILIPVTSITIISICSGVIILVSMLAGASLLHWVPPSAASKVGAVILIGIGIWALVQFFRNRKSDDSDPRLSELAPTSESQNRTVLTLELRTFGVIIQILRTPSAADVDRSGVIGVSEAFLLGTALSLDAFGAGIGAALVGFAPIATALLIAASSGFFLWAGTRIGFKVSGWRWIHRLTMLPGIILILMGLFKLF